MASQQWQSDLGDNNTQNSHSEDATFRRKSYEPFRCALDTLYRSLRSSCLKGDESRSWSLLWPRHNVIIKAS